MNQAKTSGLSAQPKAPGIIMKFESGGAKEMAIIQNVLAIGWDPSRLPLIRACIDRRLCMCVNVINRH